MAIGVTGIGMLCALGETRDQVFEKLCGLSDRKNLFRQPPHLLERGCGPTTPMIAEVLLSDEQLAARTGLTAKRLRRTSRATLLAIVSVQEALADSGLLSAGIAPERIGLFCGTSLAGTTELELLFRDFHFKGKSKKPSRALSGAYCALNDELAELFSLRGSRIVVSTACSSSTVILQLAKQQLENGQLDAAVVFGVDPIGELSVAGFRSLGGLSKTLTSPFSEGDNGLSLGEGAAALILESKPRKAPYAYLAGVCVSSEAHHPTAPEPSGRGARAAMTEALAAGGVPASHVGAIYAHGTGTELNDPAETKAMISTFAERAPSLHILSTKGATGHTLGGAGAINAALAVLSLSRSQLPPSPGFTAPRKGCTLPAANTTKQVPALEAVIANSFGFGGSNASAVFTRQPVEAPKRPVAESILITGVGAATPAGDAKALRTAILNGGKAITEGEENRSFTGRRSSRRAGRVDLTSPAIASVLRRSRNARKMDRMSALTFVSATGALQDAGFKIGMKNRTEVGLIYGTDTGPLDVIHQFYRTVVAEGIDAGNPSLFPNTVLNACLGYVNIDHLMQGPSVMLAQGECSSGVAMETGMAALAEGKVKAVLCGGVDEYSPIQEKGYLDLGHITASDPKPFDAKADGYVLGEGSIGFLLETESAAKARNAKVLARLSGSYASGSATPGSQRYPQSAKALQELIDRGVAAHGQPDLLVVNASGLPMVDRLWAEAIGSSQASRASVYSALGIFGNARGTSPALGMLAAITAIESQSVPPMPGCQPIAALNVNSGEIARRENIRKVFVVTVSCGGLATLNVIESFENQ